MVVALPDGTTPFVDPSWSEEETGARYSKRGSTAYDGIRMDAFVVIP
ncbi:MAG: hypothetical protein ABW123_10395 [Cystobacter sp.]